MVQGNRQKRQSVTIAHVAQYAEVSPATVSRVMNNRFLGEPEVAERVRNAAKELKYSPSPLARSLALGETRAIALVVPDLTNPAFLEVLASLNKAAAADGYRVLVADSGESVTEEALLAVETRRRCDSIVLCAPRMPDDQLVELADSLYPLVVINRPTSRITSPLLSIDYRAGIQSLIEHLYALGHRSFVFVDGPERSASNAHRRRGLDEFAQTHDDVTVRRIPGGVLSSDGYDARFAVRDSGATAALAYNDLVAVGLLNGLEELDVRVPQDMSVTGFDDIPFARYTSPPLTTVSVPHEELGTQSWRRLFALIQGNTPDHDVMFSPRLEVRGTTSAPPIASAPKASVAAD